ncbi:MAG: hypothetical protein PHD57_12725, partial [Desulfobacterales bacterium]|nr:hypothetical protein [Desulfobacterales bacterium]
MSITAYEYLSILQATQAAQEQDGGFDYPKLLENVRSIIAAKHSQELSSALGSADAAQTLKTLILKYCVEALAGSAFDHAALVERIYQDMAGLGVLTDYLHDPNVEEINVNGYNVVEINYPDHIKYLYGDEAFSSPTAALDIIKRMVRMGGMLLDALTPRVDSYIG